MDGIPSPPQSAGVHIRLEAHGEQQGTQRLPSRRGQATLDATYRSLGSARAPSQRALTQAEPFTMGAYEVAGGADIEKYIKLRPPAAPRTSSPSPATNATA